MAGLGGGQAEPDDFLARLAQWGAADRVARAASERSRERALVEQSAATATLAGLLVDLAEAGTEVAVSFGGDVRVTGRLVGSGRDFAVVSGRTHRTVLIRTAAITALTPTSPLPATGPATTPAPPSRPGGRRQPPLDLGLAAALDTLAADEAPVTVRSGADTFSGSVLACGADVMTLRIDGLSRRPVYLPLSMVAWVELR